MAYLVKLIALLPNNTVTVVVHLTKLRTDEVTYGFDSPIHVIDFYKFGDGQSREQKKHASRRMRDSYVHLE